jgi:multiple antibiotic resistance protein
VFARFSEVFVPLFVAMSPLTALPIFLTMTEGMETGLARQLGHRAVFTAFAVAVAIVMLGQALFRFLGITLNDLQVAGGLILLLIAVHDLIYTRESRKRGDLGADIGAEAGVVPLGTPLIVGPATMTTCVVLADSHGRTLVLVALACDRRLHAPDGDHRYRTGRVLVFLRGRSLPMHRPVNLRTTAPSGVGS